MMRKRTFLAAVILLLSLSSLASAQEAKNADEVAVRRTVQYYFDGMADNDVESMKRAFHPNAKYFVIRYNGLEEISQARVQKNMRNAVRLTTGEDGVPRRIVAVDVTGDAASVKVQMDYTNGTMTEYLSLINFDDNWRIVSKVMSGVSEQTTQQ